MPPFFLILFSQLNKSLYNSLASSRLSGCSLCLWPGLSPVTERRAEQGPGITPIPTDLAPGPGALRRDDWTVPQICKKGNKNMQKIPHGFTFWIYKYKMLSDTMEYYSAIKKNSFESVLMRWMKMGPIIQSEVSQKDKEHYSILTHIYGI